MFGRVSVCIMVMSANYLNKVHTGWDLATNLYDQHDYNNSASRMYYAVFQAVLAYAIRKKKFDREKARTEKKNVHMLMKDVVTQNMQNALDAYDDLRALRNKADYDPEDVMKSDLDTSFVNSVERIKDFFLKEATK